jgi:hypothetical protein
MSGFIQFGKQYEAMLIAPSNTSQEANPMNKPFLMLSHNAFTNAINGIYDAHVSPLLKNFSPA